MQLTKNLAYLLGALRDGSVSKFKDNTGKFHHSITFYSKSIEWLKVIQQKIREVFGIQTKISSYSGKTPYVRIYSKPIAEILQKEFQHPLKSQITWVTPTIIKNNQNKRILVHYIAGFWDAEGGVDLQNKQIKFHLSWNEDRCLPLEDIKNVLKKIGIKTGRVCKYENNRGNFPRFVLRVSKKSNNKFLKIIPIQNQNKKN